MYARDFCMTYTGHSKFNVGDLVQINSQDNMSTGSLGEVTKIDYALLPIYNLINIKVLDMYLTYAWEHEVETIMAL